jgi:hypothetical protein
MDKKINKNHRNNVYEIPKEGSLGLLALGDVGLRLWREVKNNTKENKPNEKA